MWKVEYGDALYRIVDPDGEPSRPVHYCFPASMEYKGRVFQAYMNSEEASEEDISPVFDITDFPEMVAQPTEPVPVEFEGEDGTEEEVECATCQGDGFYFKPVNQGPVPA